MTGSPSPGQPPNPPSSGDSEPVDSEPPDPRRIHFDVIVVGLGVFGLATCRELARRGKRVLGLEQYDLLHDRGSSHGSTRVIRKAYFEHPGYVALMERAYSGWRDLEQAGGQTLLNLCGVLTAGPRDGELIRGVSLADKQHRLGCEQLSIAQANQRFPCFSFPEDASWAAIFEPTGGYIHADRACELLADLARREGAVLLDCQFVEDWSEVDGGVVVSAEGAEYHADRLVLTTGPWSKALLADLGVELTLVRKLQFWYMPAREQLARPGAMPVFLAQTPQGLYYGLPDNHDTPEDGVRVCRHDDTPALREASLLSRGEEMRIEHLAEEQEEIERPMVEDFARRHLAPVLLGAPNAELVLCDTAVCQYSLSTDHHFVIDRHPSHARVCLAGGFSGHGFKFAPAVASILADMTEGAALPAEAEFLGLGRFVRA